MHPCSISNNTSEFWAGNVFCVIKFFTIDNKLFWLKFGMSFIKSSGQTCISVLPMLNPSKNMFETQKAAGAPSVFHDYENVALSLCCWLAELPLFAPFFHFNSIHWQLTKSCCFHGRSPVGFQQTDSRAIFFPWLAHFTIGRTGLMNNLMKASEEDATKTRTLQMSTQWAFVSLARSAHDTMHWWC